MLFFLNESFKISKIGVEGGVIGELFRQILLKKISNNNLGCWLFGFVCHI